MRSLTKSPKAFAKMALAIGREGLNSYSCSKSPHVYTQPQLFALLAIKHFFNAVVCPPKTGPDAMRVQIGFEAGKDCHETQATHAR